MRCLHRLSGATYRGLTGGPYSGSLPSPLPHRGTPPCNAWQPARNSHRAADAASTPSSAEAPPRRAAEHPWQHASSSGSSSGSGAPAATWQTAVLAQGGALAHIEAVVASSGALGPLLFALFYSLSSALFLPAAPLSIASGYLFGPWLGTAIASLASTAGCALAFGLSRYVARPLLEPRLRAFSKFARIDAAVAAKAPAKTVFLLRLSPLIPLTLLSYILGLTSVAFWPYVGASWAGLFPICTVYVLLGQAGRGALHASAAGGPSSQAVRLAMAAVGLAATLAATKLISNIAAEALASQDIAEDVA